MIEMLMLLGIAIFLLIYAQWVKKGIWHLLAGLSWIFVMIAVIPQLPLIIISLAIGGLELWGFVRAIWSFN